MPHLVQVQAGHLVDALTFGLFASSGLELGFAFWGEYHRNVSWAFSALLRGSNPSPSSLAPASCLLHQLLASAELLTLGHWEPVLAAFPTAPGTSDLPEALSSRPHAELLLIGEVPEFILGFVLGTHR